MKHKKRRLWSWLSVALSALLVAGIITQTTIFTQAQATTGGNYVSDGNTTNGYTGSLGDDNSTRYAGRVWTDKTVYTGDATFSGTVDGESKTYTIQNDSDFLVAFSSLATSTSVSGKMKVPVDVVFVIDNSGSMVTNGYLDNTVEAVNSSIRTLMEMNEENRAAVVLYDTDVDTLLPLGHYTSSSQGNGDFIGYTIVEGSYWEGDTVYFYNTVNENVYYNNPSSGWGGINTDECLNTGSSRGTNIQLGVYTGMKILADNEETTAVIDGETVNRVPAVILLSDGSPTYTDTSSSWWAPTGRGVQGPGSSAYYGNGMLAMATAQYMKQQITNNYAGGNSGSPYAAKVYTVGMGVTELNGSEQNLAYLTLDPSGDDRWNNTMGRDIQNAFETYLGGSNVSINVGRATMLGSADSYYTMTHPQTGSDINTLAYNDAYYDAADADSVVNIFEDIVGDISVSLPEVPTKVEENDPMHSGYITYTDPIGEYMEVKDIKEILWSGEEFTQHSSTTSPDGKTTTYTFTGEINSPVYGQHNVSEIQITVTTADDGNQTLEVKIPASAIPLRVNTIGLDANDNVTSNESNHAYPIRILYTVGLQDEVVVDEKIDPSAVSKEYLDANTENGKVNFYSNLYTGETQSGTTVGNATATFTPASTNPFYFVQEDTALYLDEGLTQAATSYDADATYYFQISYYEGKALKTAVVERSADLMNGYTTEGADGKLYLAKGSPRLGYLTDFVNQKTSNTTTTAESSYYPTFSGNPETGEFVVYLGNNGKLSADTATGSLSVSKTVDGNRGEKNRDFAFTLTISNQSNTPLNGDYSYTKGSETGTVSITAGTGSFTLKDGETITINDLPAGSTFTITENNPNTKGEGYTVEVTGTPAGTIAERSYTGTITDGATVTVGYTNTWEVPEADFSFTKVDGSSGSLNEDGTLNPENYTKLPGAEFTLWRYTGNDWDTASQQLLDTSNTTGWEKVTDVTSGENGLTVVPKLTTGNYRLVETKAPDGYQLPKGQWNLEVTVTAADNAEFKIAAVVASDTPAFAADADGNYYLMNYKPVDPPITGGDGRNMFLFGGSLLAGIGLLLLTLWSYRFARDRKGRHFG